MKRMAYQFCQKYVDSRIQRIQQQINEVEHSLTAEAKSTAGDKHETGRAMLQLEREKLGQQLLEAEKMKETLQKVPVVESTNKVALGSLIQTDKATYYIAISAGKVELDGTNVFCISAITPVAKAILGKEKGSSFTFNGTAHKVLNIN